MISLLTRTYSVFLDVNSEYGMGECCGTGRVARLFRMFSEMPARIRWLRSSGIATAWAACLTTAVFGTAEFAAIFTALLEGLSVVVVSIGIERAACGSCSETFGSSGVATGCGCASVSDGPGRTLLF